MVRAAIRSLAELRGDHHSGVCAETGAGSQRHLAGVSRVVRAQGGYRVNPWDKSTRSTSKGSRERPWPKLLTRPSVPMPIAGQERAAAPLAIGSEWTVPILEKFDAAL